MKPQAFLLLAILLLVFIGANLFSWQPGIGGRRDGTPGTELERYFGWPAVWRAELWDSNDPALASRILKRAPLYRPAGEMQLRHRYIGVAAALVNVGLLFCVVGLIVLFTVPTVGRGWRLGLGVLFVVAALVFFLIAQPVGAHL